MSNGKKQKKNRAFRNSKILSLVLGVFVSCSVYAEEVCKIFSVDDNNLVCEESNCFFLQQLPVNGDICVDSEINWLRNKSLILQATGDIIFKKGSRLVNSAAGDIVLKSGMTPGIRKIYDNTVRFEEGIQQINLIKGKGKIKIYYNPTKESKKHKYHNPIIYDNGSLGTILELYMLVNDVYDLQGIVGCLHCGYALSQNIDASFTKNWHGGKGFTPIKSLRDGGPFSGTFDGNGNTIKGLYINRPEEDYVGLFGHVTGGNQYKSVIKNFVIEDAYIKGKKCVGIVLGEATFVILEGIKVLHSKILGKENFHDGAGCVLVNKHKDLVSENVEAYNVINMEKIESAFFGVCELCEEVEDSEE